MDKIIAFIKADFELILHGLRTGTLGYDYGDFRSDMRSLAKFCKTKIKRRKEITVRQEVFVKR